MFRNCQELLNNLKINSIVLYVHGFWNIVLLNIVENCLMKFAFLLWKAMVSFE